ncbi:competence type IV pilus minor pilin ComGF [Aerococcaceae bacterium WGS1372]
MKKLINKQAFSFIEIFISLIVLSLILSMMTTVNQSYHRIDNQIKARKDAEFQHFLALLDREINKYYVKAVNNNRVVVRDINKASDQFVILRNNKIYLTPGHQPLLYEVASWYLSIFDNRLYMVVEFTNGESEQGSIEISLYEDSFYDR